MLANLTPIVTWALVIFGWWVVHRTAVKRARRQEDLIMVGSIEERVEALRSRAIKYYTEPVAESSEDAFHIKCEIQSINAAISRMRTRAPRYYHLVSEMMNLRVAITGGPFESAQRQAVGHDAPVVNGLWAASSALIDRLKEEFEKANTHR